MALTSWGDAWTARPWVDTGGARRGRPGRTEVGTPSQPRGFCGWALARAHARSGDAVALANDLGSGDTIDGAIADVAKTRTEVNSRDHAADVAAIKAGRVSTPAA